MGGEDMRHLHVFEAVASYKRNERKGKRRGSVLISDSAVNPPFYTALSGYDSLTMGNNSLYFLRSCVGADFLPFPSPNWPATAPRLRRVSRRRDARDAAESTDSIGLTGCTRPHRLDHGGKIAREQRRVGPIELHTG